MGSPMGPELSGIPRFESDKACSLCGTPPPEAVATPGVLDEGQTILGVAQEQLEGLEPEWHMGKSSSCHNQGLQCPTGCR